MTTNSSDPGRVRDSGIELLRIISILLIVCHHYVANSGLADAAGPLYAGTLTGRSLFLALFGMWGKIGINCFIMITGYFMCKSRITLRKFVKLAAEILFYRIVIYAIFILTGYASFKTADLIKTVLLITKVDKGFTSCYLLFFLCIPFINVLLSHLNEREHLRLCGLGLLIYTFFGTFRPILSVTMNYVSWFIVVYIIAAFIRMYPPAWSEDPAFAKKALAVLVSVDIVSVVFCFILVRKLGKTHGIWQFVTDSNTLLAVLTGIAAFLFFRNLKMAYHKWINTVAASVFGVLLIHASSDTMRQWLWGDLLHNVEMYESLLLPFHAVGSVIAIFIVCILIDMVRIRLLERPFMRIWDRYNDRAEIRLKQLEDTLSRKLKL